MRTEELFMTLQVAGVVDSAVVTPALWVIWRGTSRLPKVTLATVGKVMVAVGIVADWACTFADRPISIAMAALTTCFREILISLDYRGSSRDETAFKACRELPVLVEWGEDSAVLLENPWNAIHSESSIRYSMSQVWARLEIKQETPTVWSVLSNDRDGSGAFVKRIINLVNISWEAKTDPSSNFPHWNELGTKSLEPVKDCLYRNTEPRPFDRFFRTTGTVPGCSRRDYQVHEQYATISMGVVGKNVFLRALETVLREDFRKQS